MRAGDLRWLALRPVDCVWMPIACGCRRLCGEDGRSQRGGDDSPGAGCRRSRSDGDRVPRAAERPGQPGDHAPVDGRDIGKRFEVSKTPTTTLSMPRVARAGIQVRLGEAGK